jgi:two-component system chemotaxis sensor kinase CheA
MIQVAHALLVRVGEETYAVPLARVVEALDLDERRRPPPVPLLPLRERLEVPGEPRTLTPAVVVVDAGEKRAGLVVDEVVGREEVVVREFDAPRGALPLFGGVAVLRHGEPALILEPARLV